MRAFADKQGRPAAHTPSALARHHAEERMPLRANAPGQTAAPPVVKEVLATPGRPLDSSTRAFMESRFDRDFSAVRVYSDARAARSAAAVDARAYAVGEQLVFGRGEYAPGTREGRALIAHELSHVVRQRDASDPHPTLRRAPAKAKTSAGEFVADPYFATKVAGRSDDVITGYGADITITFKANDNVDATKIAFVQTAASYKDGDVVNRFAGDAQKGEVFADRMIPDFTAGAGVHVDQRPEARGPLYGMDDSGAKNLAGAAEQKYKGKDLALYGWHYKDAGGAPKNKDAMMYDSPDITSGDVHTKADDVMRSEWSQHFETTALALEGQQAGTYYGTVQWGWTKKKADPAPRLVDFKAKSQDLPSETFAEAARLWNTSRTLDQKDTFDLPVDLKITDDSAELRDQPEGRKSIATLSKGTRVGRLAKVDPKKRSWWTYVKVIDGTHRGKTGWVMEVNLFSGKDQLF